jgi:V-type H+-transporting ATPase subunit a
MCSKYRRAGVQEHALVLKKGERWFAHAYQSGVMVSPSTGGDGTEMTDLEGGFRGGAQSMLGHIAGCVPTTNIPEMELTLFRATRGNMMLKHTAIDTNFYDPKTPGEGVKKSVFVVFFSGERSRQKIDKICESYGASKYTLPQDKEERSKLQSTVSEKKDDLKKVLDVTQEFQARKMSSVKDNIDDWYDYVMREKAIFVTLNMFNYDVTHKCLIAEGWCPEVLIAFRL